MTSPSEMPHPDHHVTALMLLRAARPGDPEEDLQFHLKATLGHLYCRWTTAEILAMAAAVDAERDQAKQDYFAVLAEVEKLLAREKAMREALEAVNAAFEHQIPAYAHDELKAGKGVDFGVYVSPVIWKQICATLTGATP